jgi:Family of unknown function (DUF6588)
MSRLKPAAGLIQAFIIVTIMIAPGDRADAQNPFEEAVKQLTSQNVKGYLQPFVTSFGTDLNSGWYHTAKIGMLSPTVRLDFIAMGTLIGDAEKKYRAISPFDGSQVETATLYGDRGAVLEPSPGIQYQFQNGQIKATIVPFFLPQLTIGDVYGTQAVIRYAPIPELNKMPKVDLFGLGVRHNVSRYIPACPVELSAGLYYQTLKIGNLIEAKTFALSGQVSKSFAIITFYGGIQYETASMDIGYTYTGQIPGVTIPDKRVSLTIDGENQIRGTAGFDLSLAVLHIFADVNLGSSIAFCAGLGFGI